MFRHLYRNPNIFSRILQADYQNYKWEEMSFRYATLAKIREHTQQNKGTMEDFLKEWESLHLLNEETQLEISKVQLSSFILEKDIIITLNIQTTQQPTQCNEIIVNQITKFTALLDPNMFPVFDLKEKLNDDKAVSIWQEGQLTLTSQMETQRLITKVKKNLGFWLQVKPSSIEHMEAGNGVFLRTSDESRHEINRIPVGTLLGFVPGVMYNNYKDFDEPKATADTHFFRFDGTIFNFEEKLYNPIIPGFSKSDYLLKIEKLKEKADSQLLHYRNIEKGGFEQVFGNEINPYAVGHLINHTPHQSETNVCLIDIFIPSKFFPENLMKFWPNIVYTNEKEYMNTYTFQHKALKTYKSDHIRGLGIIAVKEIENNQELYLDYLDSCLFEIDQNPPDWLIKPPPLSPYITKGYFENRIGLFTKIMEDKVFSGTKDGQQYDEFVKKVIPEKQYIDVEK